MKDLANYKPNIYTAERITFHEHIIYHLPHLWSLNLTMSALENLQVSAENASTIETQVLIAQTLINTMTAFPRITQNGLFHCSVHDIDVHRN